MKIVNRFFYKNGRGISLWLAILLVLMSFPFSFTAGAANTKPVEITGYNNGIGTTIITPLVYGDPVITLVGTFGGEVKGENLRYKISVNDGTAEDYPSIKPTVNGITFTFRDISLKPGMNAISFYEKTGSITRDVGEFYIEYNNTPLINALTVDGVELADPTSLHIPPTLITVPSTTRLTLTLAGEAKNADKIEVTNNRKPNQPFTAFVSKTNKFSLNLPTELGENELTIKGYSSNKEVTLIKRKILVTATSGDESNQFYNVKIGKELDTPVLKYENNYIPLLPESDPITTYEGLTTDKIRLRGSVLLRIDPNTQQFDSFEVKNNKNNTVIETISSKAGSKDAVATEDNSYWVEDTSEPNYKLYTINVDLGSSWTDNSDYEIALEYNYKTNSAPTNPTWDLPNTGKVSSVFKFKFADSAKPRFVDVQYKSTGQSLSFVNSNSVSTSPLELQFVTKAMQNKPESDFEVRLNDVELDPSDYDIDDRSAGSDLYDFILRKLPTGVNKVTIIYLADPLDPLDDKKTEFKIDVQVAPYVQLTYTDSGGSKIFYDGYQSLSDTLPSLNGKIYNYFLTWDLKDTDGDGTPDVPNIKENVNNVVVKLNSTEIKQNDYFKFGLTPNGNIESFTLSPGAVTVKDEAITLKRGINTLEISLIDQPNVKYTYNISYISAKTPEISDVKLKIEQNNKESSISQKSGETNYKTDASFLSEFNFTVKDANKVWVEKNGKVINVYEFIDPDQNDSDTTKKWTPNKENTEYKNSLEEATANKSVLTGYFENTNFDTNSSTTTTAVFTAEMTSRQNGNLLEELDDEAQKIELFPLTLKKEIETLYTIVATDEQGSITRKNVPIQRNYQAWDVVYPIKLEKDPYIIVNSNSTPLRIFAENADKVIIGKEEAVTFNTTEPDFDYNDDLGRSIPKTYYIFELTVALKPGLNKIKYTVVNGDNEFDDEVQIYNASSSVGGAEYRDILGKKIKFSPFDKKVELSFPKGTVLLAPSPDQIKGEARNPSSEIFIDVPLYFGIADRTDGHVSLPGDKMESKLVIDPNFTYASSLYYMDAGNVARSDKDQPAPGGRDPYFDEEGIVNGSKVKMDEFADRYEYNLIPSKPGTLTLSYNTSIVNSADNSLTIFYHDGFEWENLGGVVNTGKKTVTVPFNGFGYYMVMMTRESFEDVVSHLFARNDMMTLYSKGIMVDYPGSGFGANREMSRGELATLLVKALDLPIDAGPYYDGDQEDPVEPTFLDVNPSMDSWDYKYRYIETAARAGIVSGKQPRYFRPDETVTRQEAAIMISRALNLKVTTLDKAKKDVLKLYTDGSSIGYYATPSVVAVSKAKLMTGTPDDPNAKKPKYQFIPNANITRAEMAVVAVRMMIQLKKLPKQ